MEHAEVFAALAIAGIAALWKAGTLRADMQRDWSNRVEDAEIGLADRATRELLAMQQEVAKLIGSGPASLPRLATVDPGRLASRTREFQRTLTMASRLTGDFHWLLRLGPILIMSTVAFLLGLGALFVDDSGLVASDLLRVGGIAVAGIGVAIGFVALLGWLMLHQRLSGAEMRASESIE
jgi:hypothetical protein